MTLLFLNPKHKFCMGGTDNCLGGTGEKVGPKLETSHFSREIKGNCPNFALED